MATSKSILRVRVIEAERDLRQVKVIREIVESVVQRSACEDHAAAAALDGLDVLIADLNRYASECESEASAAGVETAIVE
jgi:hypothetical protein